MLIQEYVTVGVPVDTLTEHDVLDVEKEVLVIALDQIFAKDKSILVIVGL